MILGNRLAENLVRLTVAAGFAQSPFWLCWLQLASLTRPTALFVRIGTRSFVCACDRIGQPVARVFNLSIVGLLDPFCCSVV